MSEKSDSIAPATPGDPLDFMALATPRLRASVERQRGILVPAEFAEMVGAIRSVFGKYTAKLNEHAAGVDRGRALHRLMEQAVKGAAHVNVSCRHGCAGCCHYEIEIMLDEGAVLADAVRGGVAIDVDQLTAQAARERKSPLWNNILDPRNRCVFLGLDGACRVYAHRPAACRKQLVTSPAEACTTFGAPVSPVEILLAEILQSAALSLSGATFGSLSKMVQASLPAN
jgi:hypothetical protein